MKSGDGIKINGYFAAGDSNVGFKPFSINLTYSGDYVKWNDTTEFTETLSEKLKLPKESWANGYLICQNFHLQAEADRVPESDSRISLADDIVRAEIAGLAEQRYRETKIKRIKRKKISNLKMVEYCENRKGVRYVE